VTKNVMYNIMFKNIIFIRGIKQECVVKRGVWHLCELTKHIYGLVRAT